MSIRLHRSKGIESGLLEISDLPSERRALAINSLLQLYGQYLFHRLIIDMASDKLVATEVAKMVAEAKRLIRVG